MKDNILIIGDAILDTYLIGECSRICPEAPVPVVTYTDKTYQLGGMLNVAHNLRLFGLTPIPVTAVAHDIDGSICINLCEGAGITTQYFIRDIEQTTTKTRVVAQNQQICRIDRENILSKNHEIHGTILRYIDTILDIEEITRIVISDYDKGILNEWVISYIIEQCELHKIKLFVDPKKQNFEYYKKCYILKPNIHELIEFCRSKNIINSNINTRNIDEIETLAQAVLNYIEYRYLVVTLGDNGIVVFDGLDNGKVLGHFISNINYVYDVTGAGDVVLASLVAFDCSNMNIVKTAQYATYIASQVVSKFGTSVVTPELVSKYLKR